LISAQSTQRHTSAATALDAATDVEPSNVIPVAEKYRGTAEMQIAGDGANSDGATAEPTSRSTRRLITGLF
jgi:hypothetical protein